MVESSAERKSRGAFYTPAEITRFIAQWAVRSESDRVLEPSCGEADFLLAVGERQRDLGAGLLVGDNLRAIEIHGPSAERAERRIREAGFSVDVRAANFFDVDAEPKFDAVVGNPPYIRYQDFSGDARRKALEAALRQGVRLSGLASSWAAFVVHAAEFLKPEGRLALVMPAELLTVKYAANVRRYLLQRFGSIRLVMFEELVFPNVQEEVVLLLAEGQGPAPNFEVYQARNLADLDTIDSAPWVPYTPNESDKWMWALLSSDAIGTYQKVVDAPGGFETLRAWGTTYLGIVTGGNRYFSLSARDVRERGLPAKEVLQICPPGSRYLRGLTFTESAWRGLRDEGKRCFLFRPKDGSPSTAAQRYIDAGETTSVDQGYKCSNRSPWWRVPLVNVPDLLLTYMDRDRPRLITNRAGEHILNSLYGVSLSKGRKRIGMDLLPVASLNSLTVLGAELVGRAYGGGLLKLEPREADRLPMPSKDLLESAADKLRGVRPQVGVALRQGKLDKAIRLVDRILLYEGVGLKQPEVRALRDARATLFDRRNTRATGSNGKD